MTCDFPELVDDFRCIILGCGGINMHHVLNCLCICPTCVKDSKTVSVAYESMILLQYMPHLGIPFFVSRFCVLWRQIFVSLLSFSCDAVKSSPLEGKKTLVGLIDFGRSGTRHDPCRCRERLVTTRTWCSKNISWICLFDYFVQTRSTQKQAGGVISPF
jgi:hypothetical protein